MKPTSPIALLAAFACLIEPVTAAIITFSEGSSPNVAYQHAGSTLWQNNPNQNDGSDTLFRVGRDPHAPVGQSGFPGNLRTVLAFDLSDIPAGSTIDNIQLTLSIDTVEGNPGAVSLNSLITGSPFVEGTGIYPNGPNNGVTWSNLNGTVSTLLSSAPAATSGNMDFLSTASFIAAAQAALNANVPFQLILIAPTAEANGPRDIYRFHADDAVNPAFRPRLTVSTIPEPGTIGFGLALFCVCAGSRFRSGRNEEWSVLK